MEALESVGRVLARDLVLKENGSTAGVEILEPSKVVNLAVNDHPEVTVFVVLRDVVTGEFLELSGRRHDPLPLGLKRG